MTRGFLNVSGGLGVFFGGGIHGALNTAGNVTYAVGAQSDVIVRRYSSIVINAGHIVTTASRCRGLILYSEGNVTINGTLHMDSRSPLHDATEVTPHGIVSRVRNRFAGAFVDANTSLVLFTGGGRGGRGGNGGHQGYNPAGGGRGGDGSAPFLFGGGYGGGGGGGAGGQVQSAGGRSGGRGGDGAISTSTHGGGAGATFGSVGNPGAFGSGGSGGNASLNSGTSGAGGDSHNGAGAGGGSGITMDANGANGSPGIGWGGGIIAIIARGNILVGSTGIVRANGAAGALGSTLDIAWNLGANGGGGGGCGGGVINLLCLGTRTISGSLTVAGGAGGGIGPGTGTWAPEVGSAGSVGTIRLIQL